MDTRSRRIESALDDALHKVFLAGVVTAILGLVAGFWLPARWDKGREGSESAVSAAECERLLIAEMATIDSEHEPHTEFGRERPNPVSAGRSAEP